MSTTVEFKKGEIIYPEGSFEMAMYCVRRGVVSVYANYGKENEMLLKDQTEGEYFGHLELIEAIPRSATVVAKEDVVLERIQGDEFGSYLAARPEENMVILTQMSARLREIGDSLHGVYQTIDEYLSEEKKEDLPSCPGSPASSPSAGATGGNMVRDAHYRKGDVVYRQGEEAHEVFFVKYGSVDLYLDYKRADEKKIGTAGEGRVFGELGVIEAKPRTMTTVAAEETVVTIVDKESFQEYISANPNKLVVVMESLSSRIRAQSRKLVTACRVVAEYAEEKETKGHVSKDLRETMETLAKENRRYSG